MSGALLLDTCALIWLVNGELDDSPARPALQDAAGGGGLAVSVTSAWEIGLLGSAGRLSFVPDPKTWFARAVAWPGLRTTPITPEIAIESWNLPGTLHRDLADRLIVATARHLGLPLVTRDRRLCDYGAAGHLQVLRC